MLYCTSLCNNLVLCRIELSWKSHSMRIHVVHQYVIIELLQNTHTSYYKASQYLSVCYIMTQLCMFLVVMWYSKPLFLLLVTSTATPRRWSQIQGRLFWSNRSFVYCHSHARCCKSAGKNYYYTIENQSYWTILMNTPIEHSHRY